MANNSYKVALTYQNSQSITHNTFSFILPQVNPDFTDDEIKDIGAALLMLEPLIHLPRVLEYKRDKKGFYTFLLLIDNSPSTLQAAVSDHRYIQQTTALKGQAQILNVSKIPIATPDLTLDLAIFNQFTNEQLKAKWLPKKNINIYLPAKPPVSIGFELIPGYTEKVDKPLAALAPELQKFALVLKDLENQKTTLLKKIADLKQAAIEPEHQQDFEEFKKFIGLEESAPNDAADDATATKLTREFAALSAKPAELEKLHVELVQSSLNIITKLSEDNIHKVEDLTQVVNPAKDAILNAVKNAILEYFYYILYYYANKLTDAQLRSINDELVGFATISVWQIAPNNQQYKLTFDSNIYRLDLGALAESLQKFYAAGKAPSANKELTRSGYKSICNRLLDTQLGLLSDEVKKTFQHKLTREPYFSWTPEFETKARPLGPEIIGPQKDRLMKDFNLLRQDLSHSQLSISSIETSLKQANEALDQMIVKHESINAQIAAKKAAGMALAQEMLQAFVAKQTSFQRFKTKILAHIQMQNSVNTSRIQEGLPPVNFNFDDLNAALQTFEAELAKFKALELTVLALQTALEKSVLLSEIKPACHQLRAFHKQEFHSATQALSTAETACKNKLEQSINECKQHKDEANSSIKKQNATSRQLFELSVNNFRKITLVKKIATALLDVDFWHKQVSFWGAGGSNAERHGKLISIPRGIKAMRKKLELLNVNHFEQIGQLTAAQAANLLQSFVDLANQAVEQESGCCSCTLFSRRSEQTRSFYHKIAGLNISQVSDANLTLLQEFNFNVSLPVAESLPPEPVYLPEFEDVSPTGSPRRMSVSN